MDPHRSTNPFLQREDRQGRGVPPERYGDWHTGTLPPIPPLSGPFCASSLPLVRNVRNEDDNKSVRTSISKISNTSKSELCRRKIEAELRAAEAEAEIEEERAMVKKALIKKRLELEQAKIEEEFERELNNSQELSDDDFEEKGKINVIQKTSTIKPDPVNHKTEPSSHNSSFHHLDSTIDQQQQNTATIEKMSEAVWLMSKLMSDQAQSRAAPQNDTSNARRTIGKELTPFAGNPEEWPAFISEYMECSELCGFTDRENLQRLRKCLKGEAKEAVLALLTAPQNVSKIIETLQLTFGTPELIVKRIIEKAKKAPHVKEDKIESLISFATLVQNLATTTESLKCDYYLTNPQLLDELSEKLSINRRVDWCRFIDRSSIGSPTVRDFADWLSSEARVLNRLRIPVSCGIEEKRAKDDKQKFKRKDAVFVQADEETAHKNKERKPPQKPCLFCGKTGHELSDCYSFKKLDLDLKWKWVMDHKVCYGCLKLGHQFKVCRGKKDCGVEGCKEQHHKILHRLPKKKEPKTEEPHEHSKEASTEKTQVLMQHIGNKVLYKILPVTLEGPGGKLDTHALLDNGSAFTLLDAQVAETLGIVGQKQPLHLKGVGDLSCKEIDSQKVTLQISGANGGEQFLLKNVRTKANLGLPTQSFDLDEVSSNWRNIKFLDLDSMKNANPTILIGLDNNHLIHTEKIIHGRNKNLILGKTKLGWTIYGNAVGPDEFGHTLMFSNHDEEIHQMVKDYFQVESDGVKILKEKLSSKEDARAVSLMEEKTRRIGQAWETGLLWRTDDFTMPPSRGAAMKRLLLMEKRMDKDPELAKLYCEKMEYFFNKNYARKLETEEEGVIGPKTWYMPHFGVLNPNKPGKVRFVFDAAAKVNGVSLNDKLLTGPDLLVSLPGCLIKFRQRRIGFTGDIDDFFPRVKMRRDDQEAQRFLWRGMDRGREPDTYIMMVNIFGAACTPYTSQAAKNKNALEFQEQFPAAAKAIIEKHYMDDYIDCADSKEEAIQLIKDVIAVHKEGDFHIGKFSSNDLDVLNSIPQQLRASENVDLDLCSEMKVERVLGLYWDPNSDSLSFNLNFHKVDKEIVNGQKRPTKRQILKVVMSMFDPLGILGNYTIQGKILMQDVWRSGLGWDDEVTDQLNEKWKIWIEHLPQLKNFRVPRWYGKVQEDTTRQLHIFCDGSEQAYCAIAYIRIENGGEVEVSLVMAKTRVSPLKPMTIPRLELQAAVIGSRLAAFIKSHLELKVDRIVFWSDSTTVLLWLKSEARNFKTFVSHRIGEILEDTNVMDWRWVPTKENAADDGTRDNAPADLSSTSRWINGPEFLKKSEEHWPIGKRLEKLKSEDEDLELRQDKILTVMENTNLIDISRFSSFLRLKRAVAWVNRFIINCRLRKQGVARVAGELSASEMSDAEIVLLKQAQNEMFGEEIAIIRNGGELPRGNLLSGLSPLMDNDGLLKLRSRLYNAPITEAAKLPTILHGKHQFTKLLIMYHHIKAGHHGQERVVNDLRQQYWIIKIRAAVKNAWSSCQKCKNNRVSPQVPEMGQLPWYRVTAGTRAFQYTGMDYFGPMEVLEGRKHIKVYGVLFTCLSVRAVHLELAESLTTDSAIMAIRRFIARRGKPDQLHSDNGTNLRGADNELKLQLIQFDQEKIEIECSTKGINWIFIPPAAPHFGGSWERMVQSVKKALKATLLNNRTPRKEVLQTLLVEAENTVNSRPLTHVSLDPDDPESLTPNHFLIGTSGASPPPGDYRGATDLRKQWKAAQQMASQFWTRWVKEYLPTLTRRTKWHKVMKPVERGDVVTIIDDQLERNSWPLGIVTQTFPGKDGEVRVVEVRAKGGKIYKRPVAKICIMDVVKKMDVVPTSEEKNVTASTKNL